MAARLPARAEVRAFIARHGPGPREHAGVRAPEPEQVPALRALVALADSAIRQRLGQLTEAGVDSFVLRPPRDDVGRAVDALYEYAETFLQG